MKAGKVQKTSLLFGLMLNTATNRAGINEDFLFENARSTPRDHE